MLSVADTGQAVIGHRLATLNRVVCAPADESYHPTAQPSEADVMLTPVKVLYGMSGVATVDQARPLQCRINGPPAPAESPAAHSAGSARADSSITKRL